jgi:hypothetical protein
MGWFFRILIGIFWVGWFYFWNMKNTNKGRDSFITKMSSPYERVFSQTNHRTRYRGVAKNKFAMFMESLAFNLNRMVILNEEYGF